MPNYESVIDAGVGGDNFEIVRVITSGITSDDPIDGAWLTIKTNPSDSDETALVKKYITTILNTSEGQITQDGSAGLPSFYFRLLPQDTRKLIVDSRSSAGLYFDIQLHTVGGNYNTPEIGTISARREITIRTTTD